MNQDVSSNPKSEGQKSSYQVMPEVALGMVFVLLVALIVANWSPPAWNRPAAMPVIQNPVPNKSISVSGTQQGLCRFTRGLQAGNTQALPVSTEQFQFGAPCSDNNGNSGAWIALVPKKLTAAGSLGEQVSLR